MSEVRIINAETWSRYAADFGMDSALSGAAFWEDLARAFGLTCRLMAYMVNEKPVLLFPAMVSGRSIVWALHYLPSGLQLKPGLHPIQQQEHLQSFLADLTSQYTRIDLCLSRKEKDIRPFIWQGFTYRVSYTALKELNGPLTYSQGAERNVRKDAQDGLVYRVCDREEVLDMVIADLRGYGFSNAKISGLEQWFSHASAQGMMSFYEASDAQGHRAVACVWKDTVSREACLIATTRRSGLSHYGLYDFLLKDLQLQGYTCIDLCGADIRPVADFKSFFRTRLDFFYVLSYRSFGHKMQRLRAALRAGLIRLLRG